MSKHGNGLARNKLIEDLHRIEELNKRQVTVERTEQLRVAYGILKFMGAHVIAQDMMYAKRLIISTRRGNSWCGFFLVPLLLDQFQTLKKPSGELTKDIHEKLGIFSDYNQELYASPGIQ